MMRIIKRVTRRTARRVVRKSTKAAVAVTASAARGTGRAYVKGLDTASTHKPLTFYPSARMNRWRTVRF
jgi:hypothetical protein